ncbi:MAG: 50S ribosomal protein L13 [Candidatus Aenigmarchaeota archaeon]|nr:50S ribosomal protein L13 [Candidatus Aenigmarchaeota archaeon]
MKTIDGMNSIMGRLASTTAKQLLKGEKIHIVNAEKVIITGDRDQIMNDYLERRRRGSPHHGPFFPTRPEAIVRRCIRSMLPYKSNRGRAAFKNLTVSTGHDGSSAEKTAQKTVKTSYVTVGDVAETLGWKR